MPALIERPKMSRVMWDALKAHIIKERQKKKQVKKKCVNILGFFLEEEADAAIERLKRERENKQKQDILTLDQTKEQLAQLESRMEHLKQEKHELFCQLKKVLHEDETKRRAIQKETSEIMNLGGHNYPTALHVSGAHAHMFMQVAGTIPGRASMYRANSVPQQSLVTTGVKRPRSPSPPATYRQRYPYSKPLTMAYAQTLSSSETFSAPQAYPSYPSGQAPFANFSGHYTPQQQKQIAEHLQSQPYQQQEYMRSIHPSLEHKSFTEPEKFYNMQQYPGAVSPLQSVVHLQQSKQVGGISSGYPVTGHPPAVSTTYQSPTATPQHVQYSSQQGRHSYAAQSGQRFY